MAGNLFDLFETLVGGAVDLGGQATVRGGKSLVVGAAQKIGWAKKNGGGGPRRFGGHKIAGHSLSNNALGQRRNLINYNPKGDYQKRSQDPYRQAMMCGSGIVRFHKPQKTQPRNLFGRSSFNVPRQARTGPKGSYAKNPRAFINFNKK